MKLAFIITGLSTGGAETMLYKLMQRIDRNRFEPHVISLTTLGEIGPRIEELGIPVHALGMRPGLPSPLKFVQLIGLLRQLRPDLVHTWMYHADLLGGMAARLAGIKAVAWCIRNSDLSDERSKLSTRIVMKACALASAWLPKYIVTCSSRAGAIHVAVGYRADKIVVMPNGFDLSRFQPIADARSLVRTELGLESSTQLIGLIARNDPQKNHRGFIEAAVKVQRALPQVHFVLAGSGVDSKNKTLAALIESAGLGEHFHLLGQRDDIPNLMASLDLLASSSSFGEAFPNVLGEAMACGVPCVVTDVGDSAEIVGDTGRVVTSGDMEGLAQFLIKLLSMPAEQRNHLGELARKRVRDYYEIGDVARRYEDFYVKLKRKASCVE